MTKYVGSCEARVWALGHMARYACWWAGRQADPLLTDFHRKCIGHAKSSPRSTCAFQAYAFLFVVALAFCMERLCLFETPDDLHYRK